MSRDDRGPMFWILGGCGCLVVVGVIAIGLLAWSGARMVQRVGEQLDDPEARRAVARSILREIPQGYESAIGLRIPFVGDFVALNEVDPGEIGLGASGEGRTFVVVRSRQLKHDGDFSNWDQITRQQGYRIDRSRVLAQGHLKLPAYDVNWWGHEGQADDPQGRARGMRLSLVRFHCPAPDKLGRVGMWLEPIGGETEVEGSVLDPAELETLLRQIDPCPQAG